MSNTYVELPGGDVEINHLRKMIEDINAADFKYSKWLARPALVDKKSCAVHLFTGQKFDSNYFDLHNEGWTHDHCLICSVVISEEESEFVRTEGYFDSRNWICKVCYETFFVNGNIEETLGKLGKYDK